MERLRQAVAAGFQNAVQIAKAPDLDSLRGRDDFKRLAAELGKAQESPISRSRFKQVATVGGW